LLVPVAAAMARVDNPADRNDRTASSRSSDGNRSRVDPNSVRQ
jgi:hypothetical protein